MVKKTDLAKNLAIPKVAPKPKVEEKPIQEFIGEEERFRASKLRSNQKGNRMCVYLQPGLLKELRVKCATEERSLSDAVSEAVKTWLEKD
jgi:hypothetical protein